MYLPSSLLFKYPEKMRNPLLGWCIKSQETHGELPPKIRWIFPWAYHSIGHYEYLTKRGRRQTCSVCLLWHLIWASTNRTPSIRVTGGRQCGRAISTVRPSLCGFCYTRCTIARPQMETLAQIVFQAPVVWLERQPVGGEELHCILITCQLCWDTSRVNFRLLSTYW